MCQPSPPSLSQSTVAATASVAASKRTHRAQSGLKRRPVRLSVMKLSVLPPPPVQTHRAISCKHCMIISEETNKTSEICTCNLQSSKCIKIRRYLTLTILLLLPLALITLAIWRLTSRPETAPLPALHSDYLVDVENDEHCEPAILREARTRFVAPTAVRLPRAKRDLLPPMFLQGNGSDDMLVWSSRNFTSEEMEQAGLLESDELNWEVAAENDAMPETTTLPVDSPSDVEWPGEDANEASIRKAQARRMLQYMDPSTDPCADFYQYACGRWAGRHPIPRDKAGFDTFELLRERLDAQLRMLLDEETQNPDEGNAVQKARDLYRSCMDHESLVSRGSQPLLTLLNQLGGWPALDPEWDSTKFDVVRLMADLRRMNNDILVAQWIGPDIKNSDEYIIQLDQTSLGLPTKDYFLQSSNAAYLQAYRTFLARVVTLLGAPTINATLTANEIVAFEIELAGLTSSSEERRNVSALYRRWSINELETRLPGGIKWRRYLTLVLGHDLPDSEPVVVFAEKYLVRLAELVRNTPPRTVANYLLWRFVRHRVSNLDDRFKEARQRFYCALFGREQAPPRWKDCVAQVNANMGMALGALFVRRHFDENSKNDTLHMTREIQGSFRELVAGSSWLDDDTKALSADKVSAMTLRIGYPDFILEWGELDQRYEALNISRDTFFENMVALLHHASREERSRLGSPVNKTMWNTAPAVVNAYYSRNKNQIMFPAGILQPPFYHRHFPRSLNFGGIGVVIGHEITHGFDDKGRLFDRTGNMQRWWPEQAVQRFHQRAQCLIDQYSRYTVSEVSMQVDGMNTQGENIADNGGIKQAFLAYQRWLTEHGGADETLPGLNASHLQLFFLNFAQVWCGAMRPEATRNKLKTAVHSPGKFRVIGTLSNSEDFAKVFNCPRGSPMNPEHKCSVW